MNVMEWTVNEALRAAPQLVESSTAWVSTLVAAGR